MVTFRGNIVLEKYKFAVVIGQNRVAYDFLKIMREMFL